MNKNIVYAIKFIGSRTYLGADKEMKHYRAVYTFVDALLFKEEKYAKEVCSALNKRPDFKGIKFETFKLVNPFYKEKAND